MRILKSTVASLVLFSLSSFAQANDLFDDTDWQIVAYQGLEGAVSNIAYDEMSVNFNNGTFSGIAMCNSFSGSYRLGSKNQIRFSPSGATAMPCSAEEDDFEEDAFLEAWSEVTRYELNGDHMTLRNNYGEVVMALSPVE